MYLGRGLMAQNGEMNLRFEVEIAEEDQIAEVVTMSPCWCFHSQIS
jgi:hypothetical protein